MEQTTDNAPPASSFTPINKPPAQLHAVPLLSTNATHSSVSSRHRNSCVSQYLGIGSQIEPVPLLNSVPKRPSPTPGSPPKKRRKRKNDDASKAKGAKTVLAKQRQASDGLRVMKPAARGLMKQKQQSAPDLTAAPANCSDFNCIIPKEDNTCPVVSQPGTSHCYSHPATISEVSDDQFEYGNIDQDLIDFANDHAFDDGIEDDDLLRLTSESIDAGWIHPVENENLGQPISSYSRSQSLVSPTVILDSPQSTLISAMSSSPSKEMISNEAYAGKNTAIQSSATIPQTSSQTLHSQFISPVRSTVHSFAQEKQDKQKPIVRSVFPSPVHDRSPVIGLTSKVLLRTCFRIGEAINQASQAARNNQSIIFELYARVLFSQRDEMKQHFVFHDLFHAKPPHLKGVYDAAIWRGVELFNYDSGRLLKAGKKCRCMGKMKRNGQEWMFVVLNIWEATWEDVMWVEGIINA